MYKFKIGDRVRVKDTPSIRRWSEHREAIGKEFIISIGENNIERFEKWATGNSGASCICDSKNRFSINYNIDDLELVENNATCGTKQTFMSKITTFVKNLTLSADEKLMRKHGLKDECGNVTEEGKQAILANFFSSEENQTYLLSIATGLEAETQAEKSN